MKCKKCGKTMHKVVFDRVQCENGHHKKIKKETKAHKTLRKRICKNIN
jgi:hypothetical protein